MLRPMDIISLVFASGIKINRAEKKYISVSRQMFYDMRWVKILEGMGCTVTIIGKDLTRLKSALECGDYTLNPNTLRTVVAIGEPPSIRAYDPNLIMAESFDITVVWHRIHPLQGPAYQSHNIGQRSNEAQICVLSMARGSSADLDCSWSSLLSQRHRSLGQRSLRHFLVGSDKPYPSSCDVWESEWQRIDGTEHEIIRTHYIVEPLLMEFYGTRIIMSPNGSCCALLMKLVGLEDYMYFE
jgi:hypothetical protein